MKSKALLRNVWCILALCMLFCGISMEANANNIRIIGKPVLGDKDEASKKVPIRFDIAWDNSWKTSKPNNHDAAWIFVKCWDGESWNHVYLEKEGAVAGSKDKTKAVNSKVTYYVSDREGKVTNQDMVLEPGYSNAWKKWHLDPEEDSVKCVVGFFLYRKLLGAGHVVVPGVTFIWNYGSQGFENEDDLVVKVFAIEMVYVPEGPYYLGGKGSANVHQYAFTTNGATFGRPLVVTSENAITVANDANTNTLWAVGNAITAGTIPKAFPKGYKAFYIMKYEMTQQAYVEFLNTLNQGQQDGRIQGTLRTIGVNGWAWGSDIAMYRNNIRVKQAAPVVVFGMNANGNSSFDEVDKVYYGDRPCYGDGMDGDTLWRNIDGQDLAVNFVSFYDLLAYAEFSGLRPMTELEFEKACRGPREPVNDEFAWGSVTRTLYTSSFQTGRNNWYSVKNGGGGMYMANTGTEVVSKAYNCALGYGYYGREWTNWWNWCSRHEYYPAPMRVGMFADSTTTRAAAGATFWGVMNMSDNVAEMCISVYDSYGRAFEDSHGCGQVDGNGNATNKDWKITDNGAYYINRGMWKPYWTWDGGGWNHNDRSQVNEACLACDGIHLDNEWVWAGMVSNRSRAMLRRKGTERNYTNDGGDGIRGIRLVRTDAADK